MCCYKRCVLWGRGGGNLVGWLFGLELRVAVLRTPLADATGKFTLGNIHDWAGDGGRCTGHASRVAEKCWTQFAVSSWPSFR